MTKLPEPFKKSGQQIGPDGNNRVFFDAYTEAQMLQFRRDALEEAALVCEVHLHYPSLTPKHCADVIRKLKDET